ncbi:MAG: radical SAM protein [Planctomycetaceae bacterium]|nr:radical SAM protein [Planctomycetaceae bacterium]
MKKIKIIITNSINDFWAWCKRSVIYPTIEKIIRVFLNQKSFRRYLLFNGRLLDMMNRITHITNDDRIGLDQLEVDIVKGCNFRCKFCNHVSPLRKGCVPLEQLSEWFETWSKKIVPDRFLLLGGEPLLHPEVEKVILAAGTYWKDSQIVLITNGMLFPKKSQAVFEALHTVHAQIHISKHFDDPEYNLKFQESIACLKKNNLSFHIHHSNQKWAETYRIDRTNGHDKPLPFNSDFNKAWNGCIAKKCVTLFDNCVYRCSVIAALQGAYREKVLDHSWNVVNGYQPLSPDCSAYDIFVHLSSGAFPECCVCPEHLNIVKPEQFQLKTA